MIFLLKFYDDVKNHVQIRLFVIYFVWDMPHFLFTASAAFGLFWYQLTTNLIDQMKQYFKFYITVRIVKDMTCNETQNKVFEKYFASNNL